VQIEIYFAFWTQILSSGPICSWGWSKNGRVHSWLSTDDHLQKHPPGTLVGQVQNWELGPLSLVSYGLWSSLLSKDGKMSLFTDEDTEVQRGTWAAQNPIACGPRVKRLELGVRFPH
jgi:hypothetical protein